MSDKFVPLYDRFMAKTREMSHVGVAKTMLDWDTFTQMPPGAAEYRAEVTAYFADVSHKLETDSEYGAIVTDLEAMRKAGIVQSDTPAHDVIRAAWDSYRWEKSLPPAFAAERNALKAGAYPIWEAAKAAKSWAQFLPTFTRIVDVQRREVEFVRAATTEPEAPGASPYDWLLDCHDKGMTAAKAQSFLASIIPSLVSLRERIEGSGIRYGTTESLRFEMTRSLQEKLCHHIAKEIGFDFSAGVLARTVHPFCQYIHPGHVGIATRYVRKDPLWAIYGVIHECGHGMYDQAVSKAMPSELFGTFVGQQQSGGMHETQSRLWERLVGCSAPFCNWLYEQMLAVGTAVPSARRMYEALNAVRSSHIRFEADEVTYNLHIAIRIETECALMERRLEPADFFEAWREKTHQYLGLEITGDAQGPLQDSHYSDGLGSFLGYALGNVWGAHIFDAAERDIPNLVIGFRKGKFADLGNWLRRKLYCYGGRYTPEKQIELATGSLPGTEAYLARMERKYAELYQL